MEYVGDKPEELRRLALRFCLSDSAVAVVVSGMKSIHEVEENVRILEEGPLTADEMREVLSLLGRIKNRESIEQGKYET
jgi:predicted aldo/keto reductase-like oxidoreductase